MLILCTGLTLCAFIPQKEKLLISGCGWNKIAILDKESCRIEWIHDLNKGEDCNDVEITREKNILYAYTRGARLINKEQQIIWDYKVSKGEELFTATQLADGSYLLAVCGTPSRLIELNKDGETIKEIPFQTNITGVHDQFRQIVKTKKGNYLVALMGKGEVVELNKEGKAVKTIKTGGNPFSVKILNNGNWLVSCGDGHNFAEVNPKKGKVIKSVHSEQIRGASLLFVAELIRYRNGNTLIANWNGHSDDKTQPLLIEIDTKNQIVWSLPVQRDIINISTVYSFFE